jgi:hypothetical protein
MVVTSIVLGEANQSGSTGDRHELTLRQTAIGGLGQRTPEIFEFMFLRSGCPVTDQIASTLLICDFFAGKYEKEISSIFE